MTVNIRQRQMLDPLKRIPSDITDNIVCHTVIAHIHNHCAAAVMPITITPSLQLQESPENPHFLCPESGQSPVRSRIGKYSVSALSPLPAQQTESVWEYSVSDNASLFQGCNLSGHVLLLRHFLHLRSFSDLLS